MAARKGTTGNIPPEEMTETFGDEDTDLSRFPTDNAPAAKAKPAFTTAQLAELASSDDPLALLAEWGIDPTKSVTTVLGDGAKLVDKGLLVNREFWVLDWRFNESKIKSGKYYCAVKCMDMNLPADHPDRLFVFTDGGAGIYQGLAMFQAANEDAGLPATVPMHVPYGLSPSVYDRTDEDGEDSTGTTYWFANAPFKP